MLHTRQCSEQDGAALRMCGFCVCSLFPTGIICGGIKFEECFPASAFWGVGVGMGGGGGGDIDLLKTVCPLLLYIMYAHLGSLVTPLQPRLHHLTSETAPCWTNKHFQSEMNR